MFRNAFQKKLSQRFFVTPKSGVNFSGVLVKCDKGSDGHSVFADVKVHVEGRTEAATGTLFIRNDNVAYCQELPADVNG